MHKAGSTTVYNILGRYSLNHDLNVALPELDLDSHCRHTFGPIKEEHVIPLAPGQSYHMLFSHMTYNRSVIERFMPKDSFYVAIMREPFRRFLSGAYFYGGLRAPPENNTGNELFKAYLGDMRRRAKWAGDCRYHNSILCDTGMPLALQEDERAVEDHIAKMDRELDLMLVVEHFDESVVLLKRRACLQIKDIIYHKMNSRKSTARKHLILEEDVAEFRAWQKSDYLAYEHFYPKFWEEIRKEGEDFHQEVSYFKDLNKRVGNYCSKAKEWDTLVVPKSQWNDVFTFDTRDCELFKIGEVAMHRMLVRRTWDRRKRGGYRETRETIPEWMPTC